MLAKHGELATVGFQGLSCIKPQHLSLIAFGVKIFFSGTCYILKFTICCAVNNGLVSLL